MANDIIIKTDLTLGSIDENFDDIRKLVVKEMAPYKGLVFADDDIKSAKSTRAMLNKLRTQIEDRRKGIKKQWNEPYTVFEAKVKDVLVLIDEPINEIDSQVKDYEERMREEKRTSIQETLDELLAKQDEYIEKIVRRSMGWFYDSKWENATVSITNVSKQISEKISLVVDAHKALNDDSKYAGQLLGMFEQTGDLIKVINYGKELAERDRIHEEQRAAELARKEAIEKQRLEDEEARKSQAQGPQVIEEDEDLPVEEETLPPPQPEQNTSSKAPETYTVTFKINGATFAQLSSLIGYMKANGLDYTKVDYKGGSK